MMALERSERSWDELIKLHAELNDPSAPRSAVLDPTDPRGVLAAKAARYTAELAVLKERGPRSNPLTVDEVVAETIVEIDEVLESQRKSLEQIKADLAQADAEFERESQLNEQHRQLGQSIQAKVDEAQADSRDSAGDEGSVADLRRRANKMSTQNKALLMEMSRFASKHFPKLTEEDIVEAGGAAPKGEASGIGNSHYIPFLSVLEELMNKCLDTPEDPYVKLQPDKHWPPYIEFLLRWGIALKHPTSGDLIKLTQYHI